MQDTVVVKKPLLTEKSTHLINESNTYTFVVDRRARKGQIKDSIERLYGVKVENVRTITRKPKSRRLRYGWVDMGEHKKAMVRLSEGSSIELF